MHDTSSIDGVLVQVNIKVRIEDIEPVVQLANGSYLSLENLYIPPVARKNHDGHFLVGSGMDYLSRRQTIDLISPFFTYPLDGIKPVYIVFSKHTMKVMGVFHFFPILDKGIPVDFLFVYRRFILNRFDRFALVLGGILVFDLFVNFKVAFLLHVNLHDGISGLVENLK